jgi:hypothetical protein
MEPWNVHIVLCVDGFHLFGSFVAPYTCSSIILIAYNLPLEMCIKLKLMFLFVVIPGSYNLGRNIGICL